ncbi:MAG TPA: hypothetical protein VGJ21_18215, partial [Terracidiphilus sp.]
AFLMNYLARFEVCGLNAANYNERMRAVKVDEIGQPVGSRDRLVSRDLLSSPSPGGGSLRNSGFVIQSLHWRTSQCSLDLATAGFPRSSVRMRCWSGFRPR